jgi:hypothetical protein
MNTLQAYYLTALELERDTLEHRLHQPVILSEFGGFDPVGQQVLGQARDKLQSIRRALDRLTKNQFGECQRCHQPIDSDRLIVKPWAELCIDCQRKVEKGTISVVQQRIPSPKGAKWTTSS